MCIQGIQAAKLEAKKAGRPLVDGDVDCACASSCDVGCIHFGDLNDQNSKVAKLTRNNRAYYALDEIGVQPNVAYMVKVRNKVEEELA